MLRLALPLLVFFAACPRPDSAITAEDYPESRLTRLEPLTRGTPPAPDPAAVLVAEADRDVADGAVSASPTPLQPIPATLVLDGFGIQGHSWLQSIRLAADPGWQAQLALLAQGEIPLPPGRYETAIQVNLMSTALFRARVSQESGWSALDQAALDAVSALPFPGGG